VFQVALSLARIGRVVKYLPFPVLAGFINGAALLMLFSALRLFIGLPNAANLDGFLGDLAVARPGALLVGCATVLIALRPPRFASHVSPLLAAIIGGTLLHHLLAVFVAPSGLSGMLGAVAPKMPDLDVLRGFSRIMHDSELLSMVPGLLVPALSLSLLATVESLLTMSVIDGILPGRQSADRELLAQGAANVASACFGGLPSAAGVSRCTNNVRGGGRSRASALVYAALAVAVLLGSDLFRALPLAMMGGVMVAVAWQMVDDWTRRMPRQLLSRHGLTPAQRKTLLANYLVMLAVVATALVSNLVTAVFVGVLGAMMLFVRQNSRSVIRRELHGNRHHSLRQRSISRMRELEREGGRIVILELDGALFFGTADKLAREIERIAARTDCLILDFRRITDIDVTGARILLQSARELAGKRCKLLFASIKREGARGRMLAAMGSIGLPPRESWFDDAETALEWAEEDLLETFELPEMRDRALAVNETQLGRGLARGDLAVLREALEEIRVNKGDALFRSGDDADGLFVVLAGSVSVMLRGHHGRKRVASLAPGVVFGEMGLLDGLPRSADVHADEDAVVMKLTRKAFERIRLAHPELAATILFNLSVEMATRLRYTNLELQAGEVEDL
jgi:SulP family sulfate permease